MLEKIQKGSTTYAVYSVEDGNTKIDHISCNMINNNQEEAIGLAPVQVEMINGVVRNLLFDITGRITLKEFISQRISQSNFKRMLVNIVESLESLDEYMIDIHQILLDPENVYINQIDNSITLLCVVLKSYEQTNDLFSFFKTIVENSQVETVVNANERDYFHIAWNITRTPNGFSLNNLKMVLMGGMIEQHTASAGSAVSLQPSLTEPEQPVKYNEPSLMTVTPMDIPKPEQSVTQQPVQQTSVSQTPQPFVLSKHDDKKKSGGLLGRMFGSKNKGEASSPSPLASVKQGGLSALKGAASQNNDAASASQPKPEKASKSQGGLARFKKSTAQPEVQQPSQQPVQPVMQQPIQQPVQPVQPMMQQVQQPMQQFPQPVVSQPMQQFPQPVVQQPVQPVQVQNPVGSVISVSPQQPAQAAVPFQVDETSNSGTVMLETFSAPAVERSPAPSAVSLNKQSESAPAAAPAVNEQPPVQPAAQNVLQKEAPAAAVNAQPHSFAAADTAEKAPFSETQDYGETVMLEPDDIGETTILLDTDTEPSPLGYLVRLKNNERVSITSNYFSLGKDKTKVSYFISDNTAISRSHASIIVKDGKFYVVDHNSTNHTYVNGQLIPSNVEIEIINGMKLKFANEEFEFVVS